MAQGATQRANNALAIILGVVQFFFATTWTLYVIYLPQLAQQAGIGKYWIPWILVADQVVFAICDIVTGFWVDRVRKGLARLGGWILAVTVLTSVAFLVLPYAGAQPGVLLVAILVWSITSSALRSPPWALLSRYAAAPSAPWLSALVLTGSAVAAAMAPYLGIALRDVDPRMPFVLSTLTLLLAVGGLVYGERTMPRATPVSAGDLPKNDSRQVWLFFGALLVMGVGFQVHFSLNSAHQYLNFAGKGDLAYLMPVFWIGFNLAMFPAGALVKRIGTLHAMALAAAAGAVASVAAALAPQLDLLVAAQFAAGACWGLASVAAYATVMSFGRTGHEGRYLGALFAVLALAAFARIAAYASDLVIDPQFEHLLPWLPMSAWALGALVLVFAALPSAARAIRRA